VKSHALLCALAVCAVVILPSQADEYCSIRPPKGATDAQLADLANISQPVAQEIALIRIPSQAEKTVQSAQLRVDHGCLIWSLVIKVAGQAGVQEVQLDADTGRLVSVRQKSSRQESAEAAAQGEHSGRTPPK
jgi:hypothetical protein